MLRCRRFHSRSSETAERRFASTIPSSSSRRLRRGFGFGFFFAFGYRFGGEKVLFQVQIKGRIMPADPLEDHRGMFLFLVAVVREDFAKYVIGCRVDTLV